MGKRIEVEELRKPLGEFVPKEIAEKTVKDLMKACDELMTEYVSRKRAADWMVINDAMCAGQKFLRGVK